MPHDKQPKASSTKPITPALSNRFRSTRTPVTPKLAGSTQTTPVTVPRKDLKEQTLSPPSILNKAQAFASNVTPRSSTRTVRISSESPASPATKRRLSGGSSVRGSVLSPRQGLGISNPSGSVQNQNQNQSQNRPIATTNSPNVSAVRRISGSSNISKKDDEPTKFFHANDARQTSSGPSTKSTLSPRPAPPSHLKAGTSRPWNSTPLSSSRSTYDLRETGFVRANETQIRAARTPTVVRKQSTPSMTSMNTTRTRSPEISRTQSQPQPQVQSNVQISPSKRSAINSTKPSSPAKRPGSQSSPHVNLSSSPLDRRGSFGSNLPSSQPVRPMLHRKSASVHSFHHPSPQFIISLQVKDGESSESTWVSPTVTIPLQQTSHMVSTPETLSPRSTSFASSKTMGTSVTSDTDASEVSKIGPIYPRANQFEQATSPAQFQSSQPTPFAQAQILAANARRERKVLDLEISNSSLLAINKTLEKELRKQNAELRRFRRLSRSGRLSFAPSNRSVSGQSNMSLDTLQEQTEDEDYSEEDEESDFDILEEEDEDDNLEASPGGTTARARKRARDEQRLMLDLAKHQELLLDSQKLTQSIRKCLNISEDLIKEGNRALKYKVGIGDMKLGGRVLTMHESDGEDEFNDSQSKDSPRHKFMNSPIHRMDIQEVNPWLTNGQFQKEHFDPFMPHS